MANLRGKTERYDELVHGDEGRDKCDKCRKKNMDLKIGGEQLADRIEMINPGDREWFIENYSFEDHPGSELKHISLTTYAQPSLDAKIMIVSQDWGMAQYFKVAWDRDKKELGDFRGFGVDDLKRKKKKDDKNIGHKDNPYLDNLNKYLSYAIKGKPFENNPVVSLRTCRYNELFITNCVLCLKQPMLGNKLANDFNCTTGYFKKNWATNCSSLLKRTIDIVDPEIIIPTGAWPFKALFYAFYDEEKKEKKKELKEIRDTPLYKLLFQYYEVLDLEDMSEGCKKLLADMRDKKMIYPVYHCGDVGTNSRYSWYHRELMDVYKSKGKKVGEDAWFVKPDHWNHILPEWERVRAAIIEKLGKGFELTPMEEYENGQTMQQKRVAEKMD